MLETLKKWGTDLTLKVKDLFTSPESKVYVKDLRKVMTYNGKKCQYPKNYDQIVESGEIIEKKDRNGKLVKDEEGNPEYQLKYNGYEFDLALVKKVDNRSYFTIDFLVNPKKNKDVKHYDSYYKPFKFSKIDLEKRLPVFEAQKTENSKYPFELTNSSVLTKEVKNKEGKIQEVVDQEGRNGELLYTSDYKRLSTSFFEVRDQNGNLELDKSLISVPIVLAAGLAKICAKLLTFIPMKLGEHLVNRQNPIAKFFGYLLFTPAMAVKNLVNIGATVLKAPILLFVADKKKYGDAYWTMWKHQLAGYWEEIKSDFSVIKDGKRSELEKKDYPERKIAGTWKELDARRPGIERELENGLNKNSESIDKSGELGKNLEEKSQNASNEQMANKHQENSNTHTGKITKGRQTADANTPSR